MRKSNSTLLSLSVIALLVLVPVLQALPLNLPPILPEVSAQSSITINNVQSTSGTVSSSPYQITLSSFNAGTGSNRVLIVGVEANNQSVSSITFGSASLSKAAESFHNQYTAFWYLKNPNGTANIVVTMAGATQVVAGAYELSGVDQTNPIPTTAAYFGSGNPAISLNTLYSGSVVLDLPAIYGGSTLSSSTCASEWNHNIANKITGASSNKTQATPGTVTCSWTASVGGDGWDDSAIEVKAAGTVQPATSIVLNSKGTAAGHVGTSSSTITIYKFNPGTGSNRLMVVGVEANAQSVNSITFGGVSLTQAVSSFTNNDAEFWYLKNPSSTPADLVVTMSGGTQSSSLVVGAYSFFGANQTNPIPTTNSTHNTLAGSPSISITTKYNNSWVLDLPSIFGGVTLGSPTCTQQWDANVQVNSTNKVSGASSSIIPATTGKVVCKWTASGSGDLYDDVAVEVSAQSPSSWHSSTGMMVPLYVDPYSGGGNSGTFQWANVTTTEKSFPHVPTIMIINPDNGHFPGTCTPNNNENYTKGIQWLQGNGTIVLGYVYTSFGNRQLGPVSTANTVENDTEHWHHCFSNLNGIFFDQMTNDNNSTHVSYYQNATNYAKSLNFPLNYAFGNPGSGTFSNYNQTETNIVLHENDDKLPTLADFNTRFIPSGTAIFDKSLFSMLAYNITSAQINATYVNNATNLVSWLYTTDNTGNGHGPDDDNNSNPWNDTSNYLNTLASDLTKVSVLSTIQAHDTSGNTVSIPIQIYQSGILVRNATTPFTYNETSGFQFNFTSSQVCKWFGSASSSTHSLVVTPTSSGVYIATKGTPPC